MVLGLVVVVGVAREQRGQGLAGVHAARQGEVGQQGDGFAALEAERDITQGDPRRTEQPHTQLRARPGVRVGAEQGRAIGLYRGHGPAAPLVLIHKLYKTPTLWYQPAVPRASATW